MYFSSSFSPPCISETRHSAAMRDSGDPSREGDCIFVPSRAWLKARAALRLSWSPSCLCPATFPCLGNKIRSRFPVDYPLSHSRLLQAGGAGARGVTGC